MKTLVLCLFLAIAAAGCSRVSERYSVTFFSASGEILGTGSIDFGAPVPAVGKANGNYVLKLQKVAHPDKHTDWFVRLLEKKERGKVEWTIRPDQPDDWRMAYNFAPGTADANIVARSSALTDGRADGVWSYAIFAGGFEGGRFEIRKK